MIAAVRRSLAGTRVEPWARWVARRVRGLPSSGDKNSLYDAHTVEVMRRVLDRSSNCIDVGAFKGLFLHQMIQFAPEGHHIAFEPLPALAESLRNGFPSVEVMEIALSDSEGEASFRHVLSEEGYSGFFRRPYDSYEERVEMIEVKVRRLDDVLPSGYKPRFVKVDVEGSESGVFRGAIETLARARPFVVYESGWEPPATYDALVDGAGLRISLLSAWLRRKPPLSREQYLEETLGGKNYYFLAHPEA